MVFRVLCNQKCVFKQRLAFLVSGWVTQSSCSDAVVGWVQVYYNGGSGVAMSTRDTTSCQLRQPSGIQEKRGSSVVNGWVQVYYSFTPPEIRKFAFLSDI